LTQLAKDIRDDIAATAPTCESDYYVAAIARTAANRIATIAYALYAKSPGSGRFQVVPGAENVDFGRNATGQKRRHSDIDPAGG
jgi:hypothetical protein